MLGYNTFYFKLAALLLSSFTAALAGFFHTLYQPIVSPNVAGMGFTVTALLIVLIGGVGTLNGAFVGALVYRLLDYGLRRYIGESASFINGAIYVLFVLCSFRMALWDMALEVLAGLIDVPATLSNIFHPVNSYKFEQFSVQAPCPLGRNEQ
jgi:ABC-type branched-subunit amino acid transport system permease subunit